MKKFTEQELKDYANEQAETIVIRTWNDGNSHDDRRQSTEQEKEMIASIIAGGLMAINEGGDAQSIIDACEYIGILQKKTLKDMNGYDSIYNPMKDFVRNNQ